MLAGVESMRQSGMRKRALPVAGRRHRGARLRALQGATFNETHNRQKRNDRRRAPSGVRAEAMRRATSLEKAALCARRVSSTRMAALAMRRRRLASVGDKWARRAA